MYSINKSIKQIYIITPMLRANLWHMTVAETRPGVHIQSKQCKKALLKYTQKW